MADSKPPKALDLFAGPGGLSLGLTLAGFDIVGAIEWDLQAGRTYRHNIGDHVTIGDIRDVPPSEMDRRLKRVGAIRSKYDIELITGGPPCPGFSLIGRSKIANLILTGEWDGSDHRHSFIDDPRNQLFREFVRYVSHFKPKHFVMENVGGMTSYKDQQERPIISVIKSEFESLGYSVEARILNASDYGVPQNRKRIIFLGTRDKRRQTIQFPKPIGITLSSRDAISDLPRVPPHLGRPIENILKPMREMRVENKSGFLSWVRQCPTPSGLRTSPRECSLHQTRPVNPRDQAIFPLLESGEDGARVLYRDIFPLRLEEVTKALPPGYSSSVDEDGKHWVSGPPWGSRSDSKWGWYDPSKFGDKMRRIRGDLPAPTVVAHLAKDGYMFVHPDEHRTITVREAARFQSFPDSYDLSAGGSNPISSQFRQVGNAVPPLMALALGCEIMRTMGHSSKYTLSDVFPKAD